MTRTRKELMGTRKRVEALENCDVVGNQCDENIREYLFCYFIAISRHTSLPLWIA